MKTGSILIDFDVIFPIQSSEFIKSLNFGSNLKEKNYRNDNLNKNGTSTSLQNKPKNKNLKISIFYLKIDFYR